MLPNFPFPFTALMLAAFFGASGVVLGAEDSGVVKRDVYDLPTPVAIQGRTNTIDQSFAINVGYIPSDSFNRGFPVSLSYSYYFRPYLAWEVASYSYNFNRETKLKNDFQNLGITGQSIGFEGQLDFPKGIIMTGAVYTPLYGKSLLFGKSLLHSETSLYLGVGSILFNQAGSVPTIAPGIQGRYFLTQRTAMRFYIRQYIFNDKANGITGITDLGIGYEFQFGLLSRHSSDEDE